MIVIPLRERNAVAHRHLIAAISFVSVAIAIGGCASSDGSPKPTARNSAQFVRSDASTSSYAGSTTQQLAFGLVVDARYRMVVTALRFSLTYTCTNGRGLTLQALILRPDESWAIVQRSPGPTPSGVVGFSDWFSGPIGHDFHVTGTFSTNKDTVTGTLHSLLLSAGRFGRCDSGPVRYRAPLVAARFTLPNPAQITLAQYHEVPSGITTAAVERRLGVPDDRDIFHPAGVVTTTIPSGVPGSGQTWLDYRWRGHRGRYFQFLFRAGRLIPGSPGRSITGA